MKNKERSTVSMMDVPMDIRTFFDLANVMMVVLDNHQRVAMINPKGCQILGYKVSEILGKNWFDEFLPLNERKKVSEYWKKIVSGKAVPVHHFEYSIITKSGERHLISWDNTFLTDSSGGIRYALSSGEDVTELRKPPHFAMIACETDGKILDVNVVALDLLAYKPAHIVGKKIFELFTPNSAKKLKLDFKKIINTGFTGFELDFVKKDNQVLSVRASGTLFKICGKKVIISFSPII
jgi:PAS domain S-box-containing protein